MNQTSRSYVLSTLVTLMAIIACVLPSQAAPSTPAISTVSIETAVAGTAQAAATQTQQAAPTATLTPIATATSKPAASGVMKEPQSNGTTLFTDYDGGYQLTFPPGWSVTTPDEMGMNEMLNNVTEQDEELAQLIEAAKTAKATNGLRAFGLHMNVQQSTYTSEINISSDTNPLLIATPMKDLVDATSAYYPAMGIEVVKSEVSETTSGIEIGIIEIRWKLGGSTGELPELQMEQVLFKTKKAVVILTFSTIPQEETVDLTADIDQMVESFRLLDQ